MIVDTLEHWKDYLWGSERFKAAFRYLENLSWDIEDGSYPIDGKKVYCMVQTYETTRRAGHEYEAHREYADIQLMLRGEETIFWAPTEGLNITKPYEPDIEFYRLGGRTTGVVLTPGRFCVLYPRDAHAPCIAHVAPSSVRKAVIKVRVVD